MTGLKASNVWCRSTAAAARKKTLCNDVSKRSLLFEPEQNAQGVHRESVDQDVEAVVAHIGKVKTCWAHFQKSVQFNKLIPDRVEKMRRRPDTWK